MSRNTLSRLASGLWRFKGTILIQIVIIVTGLLTRDQTAAEYTRLMHRIGMDYELLREGRLWHLLTGAWFQSEPGIPLSMLLLVLSGTALLEYLVGAARMLGTVIVGDWIATTLTLATLRVLSGLGSAQAAGLLSVPDAGTSALAHTGLGATAVLLPQRLRRVAIAALVIFTIAQFFTESLAPAIVHCWAALLGGLIGWFILRPRLKRECHAVNSNTSSGALLSPDSEVASSTQE